jgi:hypothetical protein
MRTPSSRLTCQLGLGLVAGLTVSACADPPSGKPRGDDSAAAPACETDGRAVARVLGAGEALPGPLAVGTDGDLLIANGHAAYVITEPDKGSTYYHYGGVVVDAVAMDGCAPAGDDVLDEVGLVLLELDITSFASSTLRAFRGQHAEVIADGTDGGPAIVRVTGVDDHYWLVEYTLIAEAAADGGKELSRPFGVALQVDYILEPDSPVLRAELTVQNTGAERISLVSAALMSLGPTLDLYGYAPEGISVAGLDLGFGMPWLIATDGAGALAYGVEAGKLATINISGVDVAVDLDQALGTPVNPEPGQSATRAFFLSVGAGGGASATAPLAGANPEPIRDQPYTVDRASGLVVDPDGAPVPGARVQVWARAPGAEWGVLDEATAGPDGAFDAPLPVFGEPWAWRLVASAPGRHPSAPVDVVAGDAAVELQVSAQGALVHELLDGDGAPLPARLHLVPAGGGDPVDLWLDGLGEALVPPGDYAYTATRGYEHAPATGALTVPAGGAAELRVSLPRLVDTTGWVSVDTHIHTSDSTDSRVQPEEQLLHAAAHGLDIAIFTEHEAIIDRDDLPAATGLDRHLGLITGEEVTATIPEHLTMFPARSDGSPRGGIVEWYGRDLDELFGLMRERSDGGVNLLNHPSYLDLIGWDPLLAQPTLDDPTRLGLAPDAALWSWDFDGVEVMNGHRSPFSSGNRRWVNWMSMVNAGHPVIAVGCSDDHGGDEVGFPRTYIPAGSELGSEVPEADVVAAFRGGAALASAGAFARVDLDGVELGGLLTATGGEATLHLHVEALPEIDVTFASVFVNCDEVLTLAATDPGGIIKLSEALALPLPLDEDAHVTVAAFGAGRLPAGLPQYDPTEVPRVLTNPIYVDTDGDGVFTGPGPRSCDVRLTPPG